MDGYKGGGAMRATEAALWASSFSCSKDYWEYVKMLVDRLDDVNALIMEGVEGLEPKPQSVKGKTTFSDPTAAAALRHETALKKLEKLEAERNSLFDSIGGALILLDGLRGVLGSKYADVLALRYLDGFKWSKIAFELNVTAVHAHRLEQVAHDWIDAHGWNALVTGRGFAE